MKRLFLSLPVGLALAVSAHGQEPAKPIIETVLESETAIPGQSVTMRVTVLVPTWLSVPIEFPSFEVPNVRVRLGDRSTTAISRLVDGEQWSGVSRRYRLSPMIAGNFRVPQQNLRVNYADPGKPTAISIILQTAPLRIAGVVPKEGEQLRPFIAGNALTLRQELSGPATALRTGDSLTRTVTATITGASPIMLPRLIPEIDIPGIRAYPGEPKVIETDERGELSGQRIETVIYMAENAGTGSMPPIELRWLDLESHSAEVASVPGFEVSVEAVDAPTDTAEGLNWMSIATALAGLAIAALLLAIIRPRLLGYYQHLRQRRQASKGYARGKLLAAVRAHDFPLVVRRLDDWSRREPLTNAQTLREIDCALLEIGKSLYGEEPHAAADGLWLSLARKISEARSTRTPHPGRSLQPLNPS